MTPCAHDGDAWDIHPARKVACPVCGAEPGKYCRNDRGQKAHSLHADRDRRALDQLEGYETCDHYRLGERYDGRWLAGYYARHPKGPRQTELAL